MPNPAASLCGFAAPCTRSDAASSASMNMRGDVEAGLLRDFLEAGRAGDVHFRQVIADHIQSYQQQAALRPASAPAFRRFRGRAPRSAAPRRRRRPPGCRALRRLAGCAPGNTAPPGRRSAGCACRRLSISGMKRCAMMVRRPLSVSVSMIEPRFRPSSRTRKMPVPPMPSSGLKITSRCSAWKARRRALVARDQGRRR